MRRLAIVATHPVQYYAPWFQYLAAKADLEFKVFYLWDFGVTEQADTTGFQRTIKWDLPLLGGYDFEFVANLSSRPGTDHFWGLRNPRLLTHVTHFKPDAVLMLGYNFASMMNFIWRWNTRAAPLLFRGDSHRLQRGTGLTEWCRRMAIATVFRRFSGFLYVGQANLEYFRMHGVKAASLFFAPHAIDNSRFIRAASTARGEATAWKGQLGIPAMDKVVLFAGKFEPKKRPLDLLQAFLRVDLPGTSLLFVGSGPLESEMRTLAGGNRAVKFAPFQNQSAMPRTYAIGDVFVLPSFGSGETWGLSINEAMCLSLPIIASTHVGCVADLVHPNRNGLVFSAGNVDSLAACLRNALADESRLRDWGEESRRIIDDYSYSRLTDGLLLALNRLDIVPRGANAG